MEAAGRPLRVLVCIVALVASCASQPVQPVQPVHPEDQPNAAEEPVPGPDETAPAESAFVASDEMYRTTFREVQEVVAAITRLVSTGDYDGWLSYLTEDYVASRSSKGFLADASRAPVLRKSGIILRNLRDYFNNVVVQSHLQATLDDIQFLDETHVKAIALVQGTPVILYYLVRVNGQWKVGLGQAGQS
jgi:hypothetical protein